MLHEILTSRDTTCDRCTDREHAPPCRIGLDLQRVGASIEEPCSRTTMHSLSSEPAVMRWLHICRSTKSHRVPDGAQQHYLICRRQRVLEHAVSSRGALRRQMPRSAVGARHGGDRGLDARHARDKGLLDARSMLGQFQCCSYNCRVLIELGLQVLKR
jgi:hypothetical protein